MPSTLRKNALLLLGLGLAGVGSAAAVNGQDAQVVLSPSEPKHEVDATILAALEAHKDPVDAYIALKPEMADELAEPRLLHVAGEKEPRWTTEGEKLRLKRKGKKFSDITDYQAFYEEHAASTTAGKARMPSINPTRTQVLLTVTPPTDLPALSHQRYVKPLFSKISTKTMSSVLEHMTSYYTRYFGSVTGEKSAMWLHDHISDVRGSLSLSQLYRDS